jgi:ligand-binding sensor domain-containing protein
VRIEREAESGVAVRVITERDGSFAVDLPAGRYRVAVDQRGVEPRGSRTVAIAGGAETPVDLVAPRVVGQTIKAIPARVLSAGRGSRRGAWRSYSVADGLPAASVTAIVQDRGGELWLGTDGGGLARFDGARFSVYALDDVLGGNRVNRIVEDPDGRLWVTAPIDLPGGGIGCLDQHRTRFVSYTKQDGLCSGRQNCLIMDAEGRVCISDDVGVARLDPDQGQFVHFSVEDGLPDILVSSFSSRRKGGLFLGAWFSHVIGRWEGEHFSAFDLPAVVQRVYQTLEDRTGRLWVAATGYYGEDFGRPLLWRTGDEGKTWETFGLEQGYPAVYVNALYEDRQGQIWLGTENGLLRFREGRFENIGSTTGLENESILAILEDRDGRLWIGVDGGGLRVLDPAWITYTTADRLADNGITRLTEWRERVAIGTKRGLNWVEGSSIAECIVLRGEQVGAMRADRQGRFLVVTNGNTLLWFDDPSAGVNEQKQLDLGGGGSILDLAQDSRGQWRFALNRGLALYDGERVSLRSTLDGLPDNWVSCALNTGGDELWLGTPGGGVSRWDGRTFHNYDATNGLANNWVNALAEDRRGHVWVGTDGGLSCFDGRQWRSFMR